jgi:hypothetical protein
MSAISGAEGMIDTFIGDFGWTFVNKEDTLYYYARIAGTWLAQGVIIMVMFGITLFLIKRKDAK